MRTGSGDDAEDWATAGRGDGEAYGRVFDRHRDRVHRHALRLVPPEVDVDDVVAVVFLEAWRRRRSARLVDGDLLPWLLVTATNVARNATRATMRYRRLLATLPPADHAPDPADRHDDGAAVAAFRTLSAADQQVLALCVIAGHREAEAAEVLGVPIGTVKSRLSRARKRLGAQFAEQTAVPAAPPTAPTTTAPSTTGGAR
ncbi:hypothetical protein DEJ25_13190 [Curtobacterium sp. MCPF17_011]|uniref:RNA polymerase sigma factor n=1 Tax=Curtobacterium sp. MCPF17_011 TaxID=2175652 RepID=UPI000DA8DEC3|nr:sigma-70 family RNA polymerase sigma factor [Curtobacterium sp. MCPF17_011]PZF10306.1 hypothetical protein DEJ25_13190 [Curtobacterium sp. MCPF17_011]